MAESDSKRMLQNVANSIWFNVHIDFVGPEVTTNCLAYVVNARLFQAFKPSCKVA